MQTLETKPLILRCLVPENRDTLAALYRDPEIWQIPLLRPIVRRIKAAR